MTRYKFLLHIILISFIKSQTASDAIRLIENEVGYGARSLALGGAYTAMGNDHSGMYWNPAGLANINNGSIYIETHNNNSLNRTTYLNQATSTPLRLSRINGLGIIIPIPTVRGSLVFGMGYNRIKHYDGLMKFSGFSSEDNGLKFPITVDGNQESHFFSQNVNRSETVSSIGTMDQLTFSFGIALSPNLSGGLSLSRVTSEEKYDFEFNQNDIQNKFTEFPKDFNNYDLIQSLDTESKAWQIKGGLKFILSNWFRMGVSLSLPYTISVIERHGTSEVLTFDNGDSSDAIESGYYDYKIKAPMIIDFGGAFTFEALSLSSSFRIIDWSSMRFDLKSLQYNSDDYIYLRDENDFFKFQYDNFSTQIRLGVETLIELYKNFGITLRGGYASIPSPKKNQYVKDYYSVGAGIPVGSNIVLDLAWIFNTWENRSSDIYTPAGTDENVREVKFYVNCSYLF